MSQFEFTAKVGYVLDDVKLYDPVDSYALLEDVAAVESPDGIYRVTSTLTGIVYMIAKPAAAAVPRYLGFINLDAPAANGYSEVYHTYGEAASALSPGEPQDAADLAVVSKAYGPKRVKTPNLEIEQFDPLMMQKVRDREGSVYPGLGDFGWTVASPNRTKYRSEDR